ESVVRQLLPIENDAPGTGSKDAEREVLTVRADDESALLDVLVRSVLHAIDHSDPASRRTAREYEVLPIGTRRDLGNPGIGLALRCRGHDDHALRRLGRVDHRAAVRAQREAQ